MTHTLWTKSTATGDWAVDVDDEARTADVMLNGKHLDPQPVAAPTNTELAASGYRFTAITSSAEGVKAIVDSQVDKKRQGR